MQYYPHGRISCGCLQSPQCVATLDRAPADELANIGCRAPIILFIPRLCSNSDREPRCNYGCRGMTEAKEPHTSQSLVTLSPKYYCFPMGQPGRSPLYLLYYSDNSYNIIPIPLILFRNGGILSLDWSDAHVYDCEAGRGKMGPV